LARVNQRPFVAFGRRAGDSAEPSFFGGRRRQEDLADDDLARWLLGHHGQRKELVVRGGPNHIVRARAILGGRDARHAGESARGKVAGAGLVKRLGAVIPDYPQAQALVIRPQRGGRADDPFLRRQGQRLRRAVLQPDGRRQEIIRAELKLLHQAQAVGERLFGAHPAAGLRQRKNPVAGQGVGAQDRERGGGGEGI